MTDAVPAQHQVLRDAAPPQHCIVTPFCKVCFYDLEQALWQELVLTEYGLEKHPLCHSKGTGRSCALPPFISFIGSA